jgi:hypothetical protein
MAVRVALVRWNLQRIADALSEDSVDSGPLTPRFPFWCGEHEGGVVGSYPAFPVVVQPLSAIEPGTR